jgi:hypothetical protein
LLTAPGSGYAPRITGNWTSKKFVARFIRLIWRTAEIAVAKLAIRDKTPAQHRPDYRARPGLVGIGQHYRFLN